tara:strand:- start:5751 stop:6002 length:252 start_codon:yes stop_codon:yes gene_type:complete
MNGGQVIHEDKYKTLKEMASDIGYSYNQVVELSSGRRKKHSGKYDSTYLINKIVNKKLSQEGEINPSMNGFGEDSVIPEKSSD